MKRSLALVMSALLLALTMIIALVLALPERAGYRDAVTAANNLYVAGEYAAAAQIYEQILAQGNSSSDLYYNLGNAYFQLGDTPRALLSYERAAALSPRDADIRANLEATRALAAGLAAEQAAPFVAPPLVGELSAAGSWLSLNELALVALASWLAVGFLLLAILLLRSRRLQVAARTALVAIMLVFLLSAAILGGRLYMDSRLPDGLGVQAGLALEADA